MNIALIGYGKMGQLIEKIAVGRGNTISKIIDVKNIEEIADINANNTDVAIEFTGPYSAFNNIMAVLNQNQKHASSEDEKNCSAICPTKLKCIKPELTKTEANVRGLD